MKALTDRRVASLRYSIRPLSSAGSAYRVRMRDCEKQEGGKSGKEVEERDPA